MEITIENIKLKTENAQGGPHIVIEVDGIRVATVLTRELRLAIGALERSTEREDSHRSFLDRARGDWRR